MAFDVLIGDWSSDVCSSDLPALSKNLRSSMGPSSVRRRPVLSRPIGAWGQRHFLETAVQPLQCLAGEVELRPHDDNSRLGQDEIKIVLAGDVLRDLQQNLLDLAHPLAEPLIEAAAQLLRLALQGFGVRLQLRPLLGIGLRRSEEHTSELQSLMRTSYAVFCLQNKKITI